MWQAHNENGTLVVGTEDGDYFDIPASEIAAVVEALLRSLDAPLGAQAQTGRQILAAFEWEDDDLADICKRRWPESRRAA